MIQCMQIQPALLIFHHLHVSILCLDTANAKVTMVDKIIRNAAFDLAHWLHRYPLFVSPGVSFAMFLGKQAPWLCLVGNIPNFRSRDA